MIVERRSIIFTFVEVSEALHSLGTKNGHVIPIVSPDKIYFAPNLEESVTLHLCSVSDSKQSVTVAFTHEEVINALVVYCEQNKTPLPKAATKRLAAYQGGVALLLAIGNPGMNLMLVGGTDSVNATIKTLLTNTTLPPINLIKVKDGASALSMIKTDDANIDLIVLYIRLGTDDETGFVKVLRDDLANRHNQIPILALTFTKSNELRDVAKRVGISTVISIPIAKAALVTHIRQACGYWSK